MRDYLVGLNHIVIDEINWGVPDSVFSSYSLEIARDYFTTKAWHQIENLYDELPALKLNSSEYKIIMDSISRIRAEISRINSDADTKIREARPNRLGIEFEYKLDNGGHTKLIFVFDEDGKKISHAQSLNGYYIELKKGEK